MVGILTREMMDAEHWYGAKHPFRLGLENNLGKFLRITGLNQLTPRPSDKEILRRYREKKLKERLHEEYEENPVYRTLKNLGLGKPVIYILDLLSIGRINFDLDYEESKDEAAERVISMIPYGR